MTHPAEPLSSALETALGRFSVLVKSVASRHRLRDADVDEVAQEVRIRLWRALPTSEKIATVGASYIYQTAVSAALDIMRRRRSRAADRTDTLDDVVEPLADRSSPDTDLAAGELADQVARAIDTIPDSRRAVVRMYLAGHPREEIAELLGWSEAKTRNLLYRGLADLRERLAAMGVGPDADAMSDTMRDE